MRQIHSWSFDSSETREAPSSNQSEVSTDLDNSIFVSEIAAVMNTGSGSGSGSGDSQHGSGLLAGSDSTDDSSQEIVYDFDYIDDVPSQCEVSVYEPSEEYSSGKFLIVPEVDNGGDSDCEISTQTVIHNIQQRSDPNDTDDNEDSDFDTTTESLQDHKHLIKKSKRGTKDRKIQKSECIVEETSGGGSVLLDIDPENRSSSTAGFIETIEVPRVKKSFTFSSGNLNSTRPDLASQSLFSFIRSDNSLMSEVPKQTYSDLQQSSQSLFVAERMHPKYHHHPHHHHHHHHYYRKSAVISPDIGQSNNKQSTNNSAHSLQESCYMPPATLIGISVSEEQLLGGTTQQSQEASNLTTATTTTSSS